MIRIIILLLLSVPAKAQTVYKTPSGTKYHLASCHMVKNVSGAISLSKAADLGLEPCKICRPESVSIQPLVSNKAQGRGATAQCIGLTKAGTRCKHLTAIANGYCYQHQLK